MQHEDVFLRCSSEFYRNCYYCVAFRPSVCRVLHRRTQARIDCFNRVMTRRVVFSVASSALLYLTL